MELNKLRKEVTEVIDDIKYHSDSLTDLERLPVIQLKVILAKINKLTEKTTILLHYIELRSQVSSSAKKEDITQPPSTEPDFNAEEVSKEEDSIKKDPDQEVIDKLDTIADIPDLLSAIGINEKYLFSSELFAGDMEEFKSNIATLNNILSIDEANSYLETLNQKYNWDDENEVVKDFYLLIQRRYESF